MPALGGRGAVQRVPRAGREAVPALGRGERGRSHPRAGRGDVPALGGRRVVPTIGRERGSLLAQGWGGRVLARPRVGRERPCPP